MHFQAMGRHGGTSSAYYYMKEESEKATDCMIPTTGRSGKGKTGGRKLSVAAR